MSTKSDKQKRRLCIHVVPFTMLMCPVNADHPPVEPKNKITNETVHSHSLEKGKASTPSPCETAKTLYTSIKKPSLISIAIRTPIRALVGHALRPATGEVSARTGVCGTDKTDGLRLGAPIPNATVKTCTEYKAVLCLTCTHHH